MAQNNADYSLVSNKSWVKKFPLAVGVQDLVTWAKMI